MKTLVIGIVVIAAIVTISHFIPDSVRDGMLIVGGLFIIGLYAIMAVALLWGGVSSVRSLIKFVRRHRRLSQAKKDVYLMLDEMAASQVKRWCSHRDFEELKAILLEEQHSLEARHLLRALRQLEREVEQISDAREA